MTQKTEDLVEKIINECFVHFKLKKEELNDCVCFKLHTEVTIDQSQLNPLLEHANVSLKRSGKGITILITVFKKS